jgi:predicted flap endonuclease-1-like 5' DNA nuclease
MSLLDKLKAVLGSGSNRESGTSNAGSGAAGATTTADTSSERAVTEPADTTPSGSTATEPSIDESASEGTTDQTADAAESITAAESEPTDETTTADGDSEGAATSVAEISGIGPAYSERLESIGIETVEDLATAEPDEIASQTDISIGRVSNWIERARNV